MSGHTFRSKKLEAAALIDNYDSYIVEKDILWIDEDSDRIMELYYFE
jgi:hypothetical protein